MKDKGYKAALLWHTSSDFINAVTAGATDEFARAGIAIAATTDAGFDAASQRSDIETALGQEPSVILSLPLDPVTSAEAFRQAVSDGTKLVFLSNLPQGYKHGNDYAAIVTDDLFQMGKQAADALAKGIGGKGKVGYIFHDANYYVTNQRDQRVQEHDRDQLSRHQDRRRARHLRPGQGRGDLASAMLLKHPDLDGIYVTWAEPADGVLAALRSSGNTKTKIVTLDLAEPVALDMVKGGNVTALVADKAYELGRDMAAVGAKALLEQETPPFLVAPALTVTKENVAARLEGFAAIASRRNRCSMQRSRSRPRGSGSAMPEPPQPARRCDDAEDNRDACLAGDARRQPGALAAQGATVGPERRGADPGAQPHADAGRGAADQGRQVYCGARLARDERIHQRRQQGRPGRVQAARHRRGRPDRRRLRRRTAESDVETVLAKKPSIILSLPVDPASAASVYDPARAAGVKLAFVDNSPAGYKQGKDYVAIVSDDLFQMGNKAGIAMAEALGKKGKVGYIFHDADFYVTNQRDGAFKKTIEQDYPGHEDRRRGRHGRPGAGRGDRPGDAHPASRPRRHLCRPGPSRR